MIEPFYRIYDIQNTNHRIKIWSKFNLILLFFFFFYFQNINRDTQETLQVLDGLDLDTEKLTDEEIFKKFGFEQDFSKGTLSMWQKLKPKLWSLFDEPYSSIPAKVNFFLSILNKLKRNFFFLISNSRLSISSRFHTVNNFIFIGDFLVKVSKKIKFKLWMILIVKSLNWRGWIIEKKEMNLNEQV